MKKYLVLTSVLALAACGGGGHSGDAASTEVLRASSFVGSSASDNNEITSMATAVVVKNGSSYSSVARSASAPMTQGGYTIYRLDNVDFKLAETDDATFNFEVNNDGRIVRVVGNGSEIERDPNDSTIFHGKIFQLVNASGSGPDLYTRIATDSVRQADLDADRDAYLSRTLHKQISDLTPADRATVKWNYLEQIWSFDSKGSDRNLTYSDFGYFTSRNVEKYEGITLDANGDIDTYEENDSNHSSTMIYSGGYNILPEATRPSVGAKYEGTAIGVVTTSIEGPSSNTYKASYEHTWVPASGTEPGHYNHDETAMLLTQNATLEIDENGKTVISMPFGTSGSARDVGLTGDAANVQWYDVEITDGVFAFNTPTDVTITKRFTHDDDTLDREQEGHVVERVNEGYYGVTTPVEATGTVMYSQDHDLAPGTTREFRFQGGYGMEKIR